MDKIKQEVFEREGIPFNKSASKEMVKAYLTLALDAEWHKKVRLEQMRHKDIIISMAGGELFPDMDRDPFDD